MENKIKKDLKKNIKKIQTKITKLMKGGGPGEDMRGTIKSMIVGEKYEHRPRINIAIQELTKLAGEEFVGPPYFKYRVPWIKKYDELRETMHYAGEEKNDGSLKRGGFIDLKLIELKKLHIKLLKENEVRDIDVKQQLSVLNSPPKTIPKTLKVKGGKTKKKKKSVKKSKKKSKKKKSRTKRVKYTPEYIMKMFTQTFKN
tara:strand:- start:614 stop:1213 length:600 start_codon:yes stop_codon:yes gene_type:complete